MGYGEELHTVCEFNDLNGFCLWWTVFGDGADPMKWLRKAVARALESVIFFPRRVSNHVKAAPLRVEQNVWHMMSSFALAIFICAMFGEGGRLG